MKEQNKTGDNKSIVPINFDRNDLGLDIVRNRNEALEFFKELLAGRKSGVTSPAEAMMVYGKCRELNLPFHSAIDHISVIGDKVCVDIHIKTALVLRAGNSVWWEKTRDYQPQYKYTDGTSSWLSFDDPIPFLKDLKTRDPKAAKMEYSWDEETFTAITSKGNIPIWNATSVHSMPVNYVTEYKMWRVRKVDGESKTIEGTGSFSSLEGHTAQLGFGSDRGDYAGRRDPNSNWGKYEKRMVDIRAFDNVCKVVAADLTMGMPEISEMAEVMKVPYHFDPNTGNASIHKDYNPDIEEANIVEDENGNKPDEKKG